MSEENVITRYEYKTMPIGISGWSFLEGVAEHLQAALEGPEVQRAERDGWELWQVTTFSADNARGFVLVFRRPRP